MSEKKKIAVDSFIITSSSYYLHFIGIITGFVNSRILGPENVGLVSGLQILIFWASFAHMGVLSAAQRDIPFYLAKGERDKVRRMEGLSASATIFPALFFSLIILFYAKFQANHLNTKIFWGVVTSALWLFLSQYQAYLITVPIRGYSRFDIHAKANFYMGTFANLLSVAAVYFSGIYGQYGFQLISLLVFIWAVHRLTGWKVEFCFDFQEAKELIKIGFPLLLVSMAIVFSQTIDRALILSIIGGQKALNMLGMLYIANMVLMFLLVFSNSLSSVLIPIFRARIARQKEAGSLREILEGPVMMFAFAMSLFVGIVAIWTDSLTRVILPKFVEGISPMYIISWVGFISAFEIFASTVLSTIDKQWTLLKYQAASLLLQIAGDVIVLKSGGGLVEIGCVIVAARFLGALASFIHAGGCVMGVRRSLATSVLCLIPGITVALTLIVNLLYLPIENNSIVEVLTIGAQRSAIVVLLWSPLLIILTRRTGVLEISKEGFKKLTESGKSFIAKKNRDVS